MFKSGRQIAGGGKDEAILMRSFLDLLWQSVEQVPSRLIPYTEELDAELDELLTGVESDQ